MAKLTITNEQIRQAVFENCIDCLVCGFGFKHLNKCGLSDDEAKIIWKQAKMFLGNDF